MNNQKSTTKLPDIRTKNTMQRYTIFYFGTDFSFEEIRQRRRNYFSLPIIRHNIQENERQRPRVYTNDDVKEYTLSQKKDLQQEKKKQE
jgi:hypothetical protein